MSSHFFAVWMTLEQLLATVQNGPFEPTICFQDYSTTIPVIYEAKLSYFRSMPWILDADALAKQAMEYNQEALRLAQTVRRAALDDNETVALLLLIVAHYERDLFLDGSTLNHFVGNVLRDLHKHYKTTYFDYAERLATLTGILGDFHHVLQVNEQFNTMLSLLSKDERWARVADEDQSVLQYFELRHATRMRLTGLN
ncbi:hypothetical protein AAVH_16132 [Aphelenchoides avenae]|nr:hypothetical protein AAVH_16132 [Aphelenchus avenae]